MYTQYSSADVDECVGNNSCHKDAICVNTIGSFECPCANGFESVDNKCQDIDECADYDANSCSQNADCINKPATFECECKNGFTGDGHICEDIKECAAEDNPCGENQICIEKEGGFSCRCKPGFMEGDDCEGSGAVCDCIDFPECTQVRF